MASSASRRFWSIPDLLLLVAELVDLPTLLALMTTNRLTFRTISLYEQSISNSRLAKLGFLALRGTALSIRGRDQAPLRLRSFSAVAELERRRHRIDLLARGQFLTSSKPTLADEAPHYVSGIRRALHICDSIADFGTDSGDTNDAQALALRESQIELVRLLPLTDLAFLLELAWLGSKGARRIKGARSHSEDGDSAIHHALSFEELLLSRGSLFLWDYTEGSDEQRKSAQLLIARGAGDISEWELGKGRQVPSLRLAIMRCIMEKKQCGFATSFQHVRLIVHQSAPASRIP